MAQYEEFTIDQGTDVSIEIHLTNTDGSKKNLNGYDITAVMKKNYNSGDSDSLAFTGIVAEPVTAGIINLSLTNVQTDRLRPGKYVYDVEIAYDEDSATVIRERVLEGKIFVTPSVTR
jgi:hypothetical protein